MHQQEVRFSYSATDPGWVSRVSGHPRPFDYGAFFKENIFNLQFLAEQGASLFVKMALLLICCLSYILQKIYSGPVWRNVHLPVPLDYRSSFSFASKINATPVIKHTQSYSCTLYCPEMPGKCIGECLDFPISWVGGPAPRRRRAGWLIRPLRCPVQMDWTSALVKS